MGGGSFKTKYQKVYNLLAGDPKLIAKIKKVAALYGIDPIHIIGAIVGEHTYNIDTYDTLQTYYVKAMQYVSERFAGLRLSTARPRRSCSPGRNSPGATSSRPNYEIWDCRQTIWEDDFMGRFVDGRHYPRDRLHRVFFAPGLRRPDLRLRPAQPGRRAGGHRHRPRQERPAAADDRRCVGGLRSKIMDPGYVAALRRRQYPGRDRRLQPIAGFDISAESRHHGDALQSRRRRDAAPGRCGPRTTSGPRPASRRSIRRRISTAGWSTTSEAELRKLLSTDRGR